MACRGRGRTEICGATCGTGTTSPRSEERPAIESTSPPEKIGYVEVAHGKSRSLASCRRPMPGFRSLMTVTQVQMAMMRNAKREQRVGTERRPELSGGGLGTSIRFLIGECRVPLHERQALDPGAGRARGLTASYRHSGRGPLLASAACVLPGQKSSNSQG